MDLTNDQYTLKNLNKINIILGKNGCGKSTLLRSIDGKLSGEKDTYGKITYITPERSGILVYDSGIEQNLVRNSAQLKSQRSTNQYNQFKQQTVSQYRKLKDLISAEVEKCVEEKKFDTPIVTFRDYIKKLNTLLDEIEVVREDPTFVIVKKGTQDQIAPAHISSGESELIALGIETLVFEKETIPGKINLIMFDEPDVHLHPDLQVRLTHFIRDLVEAGDFKVIMASHSTAILGALEEYPDVNVAFMKVGDKNLDFKPIGEIYKKILPVFGAHPLSNLFNAAPILLVEGEDDERIWQQAVRTSTGRLKVYPCVCGDVNQIAAYEVETRRIINAVYDKAKAYSLRDGDGNLGDIADEKPIVKLKLQCYAAENLLLSDEVLKYLSMDWGTLISKMDQWVTENKDKHAHYSAMLAFKNAKYDRRMCNLKEIRTDLMHIIGSNKPWEVAVGQVLGKLVVNQEVDFAKDGSIFQFLGEKIVTTLIA